LSLPPPADSALAFVMTEADGKAVFFPGVGENQIE